MRHAVLFVPLVIAGCASVPSAPSQVGSAVESRPAPSRPSATAGLASISYSTSPCFGACPVYAVTVTADGRGTWEGQRYVGVMGERAFAVTPQQFAAFARALQPYRPDGERRLVTQDQCASYATDMPGVDVFWNRPNGKPDVLSAYFGCDIEGNRALFDGLKAAVDALPIQDFIRARP